MVTSRWHQRRAQVHSVDIRSVPGCLFCPGSMNNINPETENKKRNRLEALRHLKFVLEMFTIQIFCNRGLVLFEHPETAKSWHETVMKSIWALPGVRRSVGDQCVYQPEPILH